MKTLIESTCAGSRIEWLSVNRCTIYARNEDHASDLSCALGNTGKVDRGIEGHEYLRALGEIRHVYALRMGRVSLRIVSPSRHPGGMFSNLKLLERTIKA